MFVGKGVQCYYFYQYSVKLFYLCNLNFQLDRHQHPAYDDIVSALGNVTDPHTTVIMSHPFSFLNILPYDLKRYFTYRGSLTTPPCSEVVIWLDFEQPVRLTHEQVRTFSN